MSETNPGTKKYERGLGKSPFCRECGYQWRAHTFDEKVQHMVAQHGYIYDHLGLRKKNHYCTICEREGKQSTGLYQVGMYFFCKQHRVSAQRYLQATQGRRCEDRNAALGSIMRERDYRDLNGGRNTHQTT